jgi:hypothetical protein
MALAALVGPACLAGVAACSATAAPPTMPAEVHHLPTVLGPLNGSGNKTFTITIRPSMAIELGCLGNRNDLAWVRSPIMGFSVQCGSPGNDLGFLSGLLIGFRPGQRVTVRITAPARDTRQIWITGAKTVGLARGEDVEFVALRVGEACPRHVALANVGERRAEAL